MDKFFGMLVLLGGMVAVGYVLGQGATQREPLTVVVDPEGQASVQEVYDMLVGECRTVPWKHVPPARPTCEDMSMLMLSELLLHGEVKTR